MAQFTIYKSTDAGAPVLTGQTGTLVALLKACLVDGYGAKAATGWTEPFTGVSKGAFKQGAGSGFYLRVQDDGPGAGTFKEARITGYETMTDVDTGTQPFPTAAQGVGGVAMRVVRKSNAASAAARAWIVIADSRTFYVLIATTDIANAYFGFGFGDFYSFTTGDVYNCFLWARAVEDSAVAGSSDFDYLGSNVFFARAYTGLGSSLAGTSGTSSIFSATSPLVGTLTLPNPSDGGLYVASVYMRDSTTNVRGLLRGLWAFGHSYIGITDGDTFSGTGSLAGYTFLLIKTGPSSAAAGWCFETSNTLLTN